MRRLLAALPVVLLLLAGCGSTSTPPPPPPPPPAPVTPTAETTAGEWAGRIGIPGAPLEIGIRLTAENGALHGEIDIPAQAIKAMPLTDVQLEARDLYFRLPDVGGDAWYRGTFEADGKSIPGAFTQYGQSFPLVLRPGPVAGRPQEPKPPFPYRIEEVKYPGQGVDIAGTLTLPQGPGPFTTVVLLTGSGAQNRDEELFGHKPFLLLADILTRAGYAVLRVDDRGIGGSTGSIYDSNYDQLTGDVVAGLDYLRSRQDINGAKIGLLGHSEGGYLVPLVAQRTPIAFAIMMAGPAAPGEEVLALQNQLLLESAGAPPQVVSQQIAYVHTLVALLRAEDYQRARALAVRQLVSQATGLPPEQQPSPDQIEAQVAATVNPYYRSWAVHDPAPALQALRVPALAFFGGADLQVPAGQNEPLMRSLLAGDPDATVRTLPGLNHLMQPAGTGGLDEYATIDTTIDPSALDLVRSWLTQRFPA
ncbi:alpha/beta hydrolase family protein [Pseudonocardia sp. DLS-67]